ncbi:hypothetical protein [Flavobacterium sp. GNP002]
MDFNYLTSLWKNYNNASSLLTKAMGGTANEVGEFAERLVAVYYNAQQLTASNKSADLKTSDNKLIQVKSRKLDKLTTTSLNVFRSWDFDILVVVLFSKDGNILKGIEINSKDAQKIATSNSHQNGDVLTTNSYLLNHSNAVDITIALQSLINGQTNTKTIQKGDVSRLNSTHNVTSLTTKNVFDRIYKTICEDLKSGSINAVGITPITIDNEKNRFGNDKRTESRKNMALLFDYFIQKNKTQLSRNREDWFSLINELTKGKTKTIDYIYYTDFLQEMLNRYYKLSQNKI